MSVTPRVSAFVARALALAGACVVTAGCSSDTAGDPPTTAPPSAPPEEERASPPASSPTGASSASAPPPRPIGFAALPPSTPAAATVANMRALGDHRAQRWEKSLAGFEEAVRLAPHSGVARFNLACARSRTGDVAGAAAVLASLIEEDLPLYAPKLEGDPDLEAVRASPAGAELRAKIEAERPRWRDAAKGGLPAILWRGGQARSGSLMTSFIRPGVYRHDVGRFVPLGPTPPELVAALVDPAAERVVLLSAGLASECSFDFCPRVYGYEAVVADLFGEARLGPKRAPVDAEQMIWGVAVEPVADGFRLNERSAVGGAWVRVTERGAKADPSQAAPTGPWISFQESGALRGHRAGGYSIEGRDLRGPDGSRVSLDARHAGADASTILPAKDPATVLVLTVRSRCVCDVREGSDVDHVLSTVDLATKKATVVLREPGTAAMALGEDGALYLQQGTKTKRWASGRPDGPSETLPDGVLLTTPDFGPSNCCGL